MRPKLQALQDAAEWLTENNADDKVTTAEVKDKLSDIIEPFNALEEKVNTKEDQLNKSLVGMQDFDETHKNFLEQIAELELRANRMKPLSVKYDTLWKQADDFDSFEKDAKQLEPLSEQIAKEAKKTTGTSSPKQEGKEPIDEKVNELKNREDNLASIVRTRREELDKLLPVSKELNNSEKVFEPELKSLEEMVEKLKPVPVTREKEEQQKKLLKVG